MYLKYFFIVDLIKTDTFENKPGYYFEQTSWCSQSSKGESCLDIRLIMYAFDFFINGKRIEFEASIKKSLLLNSMYY